MIDRQGLLADLRRELVALEDDIRERTAETAGVDGAREHLSLKGLDESFPARRIVAVEAD